MHCRSNTNSESFQSTSFKFLNTIESTLNDGFKKTKTIDDFTCQNIDTFKPPAVSRTIQISELSTNQVYSNLNLVSNEILHTPWKKQLYYFQTVHVSMLALHKMTTHAISGGSIEIMGMLLGYHHKNDLIVLDCYPLPVQGTESRVNPQNDSYEFMLGYLTKFQQSGVKREHILGWYHSHPNFGCWLSGIDVQTQKLHQGFEDPYVAIVIDPIKSLKDGIIDIGAFRTFYDSHKNNIVNDVDDSMGWHSNEYYPLNVKMFVTELDKIILNNLNLNNVKYSQLVVKENNSKDELLKSDNQLDWNSEYYSILTWKKLNSLVSQVSIDLDKNSDVNNDGNVDTRKNSIRGADMRYTQNNCIESTVEFKSQNLTMTSTNSNLNISDNSKLDTLNADITKTGVEMDIISTNEAKNLLIRDIQRKLFS